MMKVIWLPQAKKQLRHTANYIFRQFGAKERNEFLQNVYHINALLAENPNMGPVEPLLADRAVMYRSVVANRLNKIVYFIKDDHIEVADFWDTRREPNAQAAQVK